MDNLLIFRADISQIEKIQNDLSDRFKMTNLGNVSHSLSWNRNGCYGKKTIEVPQVTYMKKVLKHFGMQNCRSASVFMDPRVASSILLYDQKAGHDNIV